MRVLLPISIIEDDAFVHPPKGIHQYKLAYIVDRICFPNRKYENDVPSEERDWVSLSSKTLKNLMGDSYKGHLAYLEERGFILTRARWSVGVCSQYKLDSRWLEVLVPYDINKPTFERKIKEKRGQKEVYARDKHPYLTSFFNEKLTINSTEAEEYITKRLQESTLYCSDKEEESAYRKHYGQMHSIHQITSGVHNLHAGDKCKRFYSVLTNMSKDLREFLRYDGQSLMEWDIRNSQPLFSGVLFNPEFYEGSISYNLEEIVRSNRYLSEGGGKGRSRRRGIMFPKILEYPDRDDIEVYLSLIRSKRIYEHIAERLTENGVFCDRNVAKKIVIQAMYYDPNDIHNKKAQQFREIFPTVMALFDELKMGDYKRFSLIMQNLEAKFVLDHLVGKMRTEFPGVPFFTIHDSFLIPENEYNRAAKMLDEELSKFKDAYIK